MGFQGHDDAGVVRLDGDDVIVQTVDFFTPIVDDPYDFGQIAAANALSDIYAMGGEPLFALNIAAFPVDALSLDVITQILIGGSDKAKEAGISIIGGHTIDDKEPKYGLVVTGKVDINQLVRNSTALPGDCLILTKPIGSGIISTAIKQGVAHLHQIDEVTKVMTSLNDTASELMKKYRTHAATDITGYGLLGHLYEMCETSGVSATIEFDKVPLMEGVEELAQSGISPGGSRRNLDFILPSTVFHKPLKEYQKLQMADAQTSGGLLISIPVDSASAFLTAFNSRSPIKAQIIGEIIRKEKTRIFVR